ncbi:MAG TPA: hypothetical protein VFS39_12730 [Nitrospira sp.]|nr:hypothetical protein [Nitrospira sp.]
MTSGTDRRRLRLPCALITFWLAGCNMTTGLVSSPRTPVEQLLLTQSLLRSLDNVSLPLRPGESVAVETAWAPTHADFAGDRLYAEAVLISWLARRGAVIAREHPTYRIRVLLHAFGLEKNHAFFGIPAIQSLVVPFALPEFTLYQKIHDRGYTRLSLDIMDEGTGRLVAAPSPVEATVYYVRYTVLFVFSWKSTDLIPPPLP